MKPVRSILLFIISVALLSACFDEPEFSDIPQIKFESVYFGRSPKGEDSLVVSFSFKDGDGNMGLSSKGDVDSPYHDINFIANDNGQFFPLVAYKVNDFTGFTLAKSKKTPRGTFYEVSSPQKSVGELLTLQSRNEGFSLPPFVGAYTCIANEESYLNRDGLRDTIFVHRSLFPSLIKNKATKVDSLVSNTNPNQYWYAVVDYFYIQRNIGQNNMYVEFYVEDTDGTFKEYDFAEHGCDPYDSRFPVLTDRKRPLEGVVDFDMVSSGFLDTFGNKKLKLLITIYDRALNKSNTIETPEFRLEEI